MTAHPSTRRTLLRGTAVAGASAAAVLGVRSVATAATTATSSSADAALAAATSCPTVTKEETEGPYWVDEQLNRSDVRYDTGSASTSTTTPVSGVPLTLTINLTDADTCLPRAGAYVDIWHCNAGGLYSDVSGSGNSNQAGHNYLRGYQVSDASGNVTFTTVHPGWYSGRTIHIHVRVRTSLGSSTTVDFTTQIYFAESTNLAVQAQTGQGYKGTSGYTTRNANDGLYDASLQMATTGDTTSGYTGTFAVALDFDDATTSGTTTSGGTTSTTTSSGTSTTSGGTTDTRVSARVGGVSVLTRKGRRLLRVAITPHERVAAKILLLDDDDVLARRRTGWLPSRRRAVGVAVPDSVPAGTYHVQVTLADRDGHKKITRRLVHLPHR